MTQRPRVLVSLILVAGLTVGTSLAVAAATGGGPLGRSHAGRQGDGSVVTSTGQRLTPAGHQLEFPGRPTAIAVRPDGRTATLLNSKGGSLVVVDVVTRKVLQTYGSGSGSFDGVAYNHAGTKLFASDAGGSVLDLAVGTDGTLTLVRTIAPPRTTPGGVPTDVNAAATNAYPGGLAFSSDDTQV